MRFMVSLFVVLAMTVSALAQPQTFATHVAVGTPTMHGLPLQQRPVVADRVEPIVSMGVMQPETTPPSGLADQLVNALNSHNLDGITFVGLVGFSGDAVGRWRAALLENGVPDADVPAITALVDAIVTKTTNDAATLTAPVKKPKPAAQTPPKPSTTPPANPSRASMAARSTPPAPLPRATVETPPGGAPKSPLTPPQGIAAADIAVPSATTANAPVGWAAAETVTPDQLQPGDIVFVYSPYQFVMYQDTVSTAAPLPDAPRFWRSGVVFRTESERFGLSMDYVQSRSTRTVWTVVEHSECIEIKRFGSVPYTGK